MPVAIFFSLTLTDGDRSGVSEPHLTPLVIHKVAAGSTVPYSPATYYYLA